MSSSLASSKKVFIQIESAAEQEENIKSQRKTLKVLQGAATNKENLAGRKIDKLNRLKGSSVITSELTAKRKKTETKAVETQTSPGQRTQQLQLQQKTITVEDLTSNDEAGPSEHYWERLAERRRVALEDSLNENKRLYEHIESLEEELNTSRQELEEAKHLVAILTELINEESGDNADEVVGEQTPTDEGEEEVMEDMNAADDQTEEQ